ncbi:MAG: hypothetical protein KDA89_11810 [Planctomycetaceae bacterium]|nr:hypothetical protein [Planctomycetaceae bacterium]
MSNVLEPPWVVGECAAEWTERFAHGRTDADFGEMIRLTQPKVHQSRQLWVRFEKCYTGNTFLNLNWSKFRKAVSWDDTDECLQWAADFEASVAEMKTWRVNSIATEVCRFCRRASRWLTKTNR